MNAQLTEVDHEHMRTFPQHRKTQVMKKIMSLTPVSNEMRNDRHQFEKTLLNLRRGGYRLIDLQSLENAFTTVWYRKGHSLLGRGADVTMVLWECNEDSDATTVMNWKV